MDKLEFIKNYEMEERHWWFKGRREVLRSVLNHLDLGDAPLILEAGCGTGGNLPMLMKYGQVKAMEYDPLALEFAREKHDDVEIIQGSLPHAIGYNDGMFDLICAFDVLEHIEDDAAAVTGLSNKLKPGGRLFCTVPANQWMWSRHDEIYHHYRRYSLSRFRRLFTGSGLDIVRASYFNTLLFPVTAAVRLLGLAEDDQGSNLKEQNSMVNGILSRLFSTEKYLVPNFRLPFGVSVLCVAQKPPHINKGI